jgi:hypothetical protein
MDDVPGNKCPICGLETWTLFYSEDTDLKNGGHCRSCDFTGCYINGRLVQLA